MEIRIARNHVTGVYHVVGIAPTDNVLKPGKAPALCGALPPYHQESGTRWDWDWVHSWITRSYLCDACAQRIAAQQEGR